MSVTAPWRDTLKKFLVGFVSASAIFLMADRLKIEDAIQEVHELQEWRKGADAAITGLSIRVAAIPVGPSRAEHQSIKDEIDKRFDDNNRRLDHLEKRMDDMLDRMPKKLSAVIADKVIQVK